MYTTYQEFVIRDWRSSDREAAAALVAQIMGEYGLPWQPEESDRDLMLVESFYHDRGGELWVVEHQGALVGTGGYYPVDWNPGGQADLRPGVELRKVYLGASVRGIGLGSHLVNLLEAAIAGRGFQNIWIETSTTLDRALKFYRHKQYQLRPDRQPQLCRCDLVLHKQIQPSPPPLPWNGLDPLVAIAATATGAERLVPLCHDRHSALWLPWTVLESPQSAALCQSLSPHQIHGYQQLKQSLDHLWHHHHSLVFCLATGAVVRLIAPHLHHKATDPAVITLDEAGQFVISLCSGHRGQADRLAQQVARLLGSTPVITGATPTLPQPPPDTLGLPFGWTMGSGAWTTLSSLRAQNHPVEIRQTAGSPLWRKAWPELEDATGSGMGVIHITPHIIPAGNIPAGNLPQGHWHPKVLWVGIGCERGSSDRLIGAAIAQACVQDHLAEGAIAGIATLDLKADEPGLLKLCRDRGWPLRCFSAEELAAIAVPNPSPAVAEVVGTPSVAEAAALLAASQVPPSPVPLGDPEPPACAQLRVPKRVVRALGQPGAVTVAIAQGAGEVTGRRGSLALVGTGPGAIDQITPAAQGAIAAADVVVGYGLYMDLVRPLVRSGQILETLPLTQEQARADRAIALAQWGLQVAVISSGDSGIYGMAGLVMETLSRQGWDGQTPQVMVFPGITALQSAAALVGTPLMHDFCAISLSDLLTPWPVIEKRLRAVAAADFVVALYNPKSKARTTQIAEAQGIFLAHRSPGTPVALVRSAYRVDQQVVLTTLGELLDQDIDMLTTVLIGNGSTYRHGDLLITPRGYNVG